MADGQTDPAPGGQETPGEKKEHNQSSGSIDDSKPGDRKVQEKRGFRRWWDKLSGAGKTLTVGIPTIASALAILTTLGIIGGSSSSSQLPGYVALRQPDLLVQKAPNLSAPSVGSVPYDTTVHIVCTKDGDPVTGPGNGGRTTTSRLWDYIQSSISPPGFVPDVWVDTGTTKPEARSC
jgi:hypothetical protein